MKESVAKRLILTAAFCLILALVCGACAQSKTAVTSKDFISKAASLGLNTQDTTSTYAQYDHVVNSTSAGRVEGAAIAWQADFVTVNAADKAEAMFETNKDNFDQLSGNMSMISSGNYNTYEKTGDGQFMYLCRVDKTLLYIKVAEKYKDEAKQLIEALGY